MTARRQRRSVVWPTPTGPPSGTLPLLIPWWFLRPGPPSPGRLPQDRETRRLSRRQARRHQRPKAIGPMSLAEVRGLVKKLARETLVGSTGPQIM
jgi:hypothetical protein